MSKLIGVNMNKKNGINVEISVSTLVEALLKLESVEEFTVAPVERVATVLQIRDTLGYPRGWIYENGEVVIYHQEGEAEE